LSRVFDARKRAERSKHAGDAIEQARIPKSSSDSSGAEDSASIHTKSHGTSPNKRAAAQQIPVVRSLLRITRSSDPRTPKPIQQSGNSVPAMLILPKDPIYPAIAKEQQISGSVEVQFRISREGRVYDMTSVDGQPILVQAAIAAMEKWYYEPARLNGAPIDSQSITNFDFKLS
jgi:TonB family protein